MSKPSNNAQHDLRSLEVYHGRRLKQVAAVGNRAGHFSLWHTLKSLFSNESACTHLARIQAPLESGLEQPDKLLPLLSAFNAPYCLELYKDSHQTLHFQLAFSDADRDCPGTLRALFGSSLIINETSVESWNMNSGLNEDSYVSYLLPTSGLYPLRFALTWKDADVLNLIIEKLQTYEAGPQLLQLYVKPLPDSGQTLATDIRSALSHLNKQVEPFRLGLIRERFSEPLAMFSLRLLGTHEPTQVTLVRSLSVLNAPFNRFRQVRLNERKQKQAANAVLNRSDALSDGLSYLSLPELAGLWHLPLTPDYAIERARVREVATARLTTTGEPGRVFGYHTRRGQRRPVILPYHTRNNHVSVFGRSQSGKTTAMLRIGAGDIENGLGVAFVDQHDLPQRILPHIPRERWDDVVLISPRSLKTQGRMFPLNLFDIDQTDSYGIEFVCETLKEILGRAFSAESIGPRTSYILDVATTALLKDPRPDASYTVLDLSRVMLDKAFRAALAERVARVDEDTAEKLYGFDKLPKDSFSAPLNKLQLFSRDSIRPLLAAKQNGFKRVRGRHNSLLDAKPIVICDLADIPHASAVAIGSIVLALLQLEAFRRNPQDDNELFNVYVDEAAAFLSMENTDLITRTFQECAKFRLSLTLINQSYDTIPPTVRKTLSTNVAALVYFAMGIGSGDAKIAKAELHDLLSEEELNALPVGRAALRLGREVFSIESPDFKTPHTAHTKELIAYALKKHGVATAHTRTTNTAQSNSSVSQTPHTGSGGESTRTATPHNDQKRKPLDLSKLQGQQKQQAVKRLLAVCGLVPLSDLNDVFFPDSAAYGRQFLKRMTRTGDLQSVKLGKRSAYCLSPKAQRQLEHKDNGQRFVLPDPRLWEHSAMTGSVGARLCALAAKRGAKADITRESDWKGLRPDLHVTWNEGERSNVILVEADRATESAATFKKEKLEQLETILGGGWESLGLLVVVPNEKRMRELQAATSEYPKVAKVARFIVLDNWAVGGDIFAQALCQSTTNTPTVLW